MATSKKVKTEHAGAKNCGGYRGKREEAKQISKKLRRENGKKEVATQSNTITTSTPEELAEVLGLDQSVVEEWKSNQDY